MSNSSIAMVVFIDVKISNAMVMPSSQQPIQGQPPQNNPGWMQTNSAIGYPNQQANMGHQQNLDHLTRQAHLSNPQLASSQFHASLAANQQTNAGMNATSAAAQQMMQALSNQRPNHSPQPGINIQQSAGPSGLQQTSMHQQPQQRGPQHGPMGPIYPSNVTMPPIADPKKFTDAFHAYLQQTKVRLDPQLLSVDNRQINLHDLHMEVMRLGGGHAVSLFAHIYHLSRVNNATLGTAT